MTIFPKNELFQFMAWMLYTMTPMYDVMMKDAKYYMHNREKKCIYIHYIWFIFIYGIVHGCMIFSIYLFMRWSKDITQWSFFTAPIIYIILINNLFKNQSPLMHPTSLPTAFREISHQI